MTLATCDTASKCLLLAMRPDALVFRTMNFGTAGEIDYSHIAHLAASGLLRLSVCDPGSVPASVPRGVTSLPRT